MRILKSPPLSICVAALLLSLGSQGIVHSQTQFRAPMMLPPGAYGPVAHQRGMMPPGAYGRVAQQQVMMPPGAYARVAQQRGMMPPGAYARVAQQQAIMPPGAYSPGVHQQAIMPQAVGSGCEPGMPCASECTDGCTNCTGGECLDGCVPCPPPKCGPCLGVFGEFLYLRARDAEVAYGVPIDGPIAPVLGNGIQVGRTALVDPNHNSGFRVGLSKFLSDRSRITGQWAHYESKATDQVATQNPFVIRSLVTHPLGINAASDGLNANATYDIDFELVDLAYGTPLWCSNRNWLEYFMGLRYGRLDQVFHSVIATNGNTTVDTDIAFNGLGPRLGLYGKRHVGCFGLHFYGRSEASFLVGKFDADYRQFDANAGPAPGPVVNNTYESGRIVSQLELELGMGWTTPKDRFSLTAGYLVSTWLNTVRTDEFINAVQNNNPDDLGENLTFDGLRIRGELRF